MPTDDDVLEFLVLQEADGSYVAHGIGACIVTTADTLDELESELRDAVCCHYDEDCAPCEIKLKLVQVLSEKTVTP